MNKKNTLLAVLFVGFVFMCGCSSNDQFGGGFGGIPGQATVTITDASGNPISGATVYIPSQELALTAFTSGQPGFLGLTDSRGNTCDDPLQTASASSCTDGQGVAVLDCSEVGPSPSAVVEKNGQVLDTLNLVCGGFPFTHTPPPQDIVMVYTGDRDNTITNGTLLQFLMNQTSGLITETDLLTTAGNSGPMVFHPGGFLYVMNSTGSGVGEIITYRVSEVDGHLTEVLPRVDAGEVPVAIVIHPSNNFLFVANSAPAGEVSRYSINTATGQLTELLPKTTVNSAPLSLASTSSHLYVGNGNNPGMSNDPTVDRFSVNPTTGALTPVDSIEGPLPPRDLEISPNGGFLYAVGQNDDNIFVYSIDGSGALIQIQTLGTGPFSGFMDLSPNGQFLYVANSDVQANPGTGGSISQYSVAGNGMLTELLPKLSITNPLDISVDPTNQFAFASGWDGTNLKTYSFTIAGDGRLSESGTITQSAVSGLGAPSILAVDPSP